MSLFRKFSEKRKSKRQSQLVDTTTPPKLSTVKETTDDLVTTKSSEKDESEASKYRDEQPRTGAPQGKTETAVEKQKVEEPRSSEPPQQDASTAVKQTAENSKITQPNEVARTAAGTSTISDSLQRSSFLTLEHYDPVGNVKPPPKESIEHVEPATRAEVESAFERFAQLIHASNRPLPSQTADGSYLKRDEPTGILADIKNLGFKDLNTVRRILEQKASGEPQDDRQYLMESIMQLVAALPERSKNRVELTSQFLDELWNSLQHPPLSYMGNDFKYRSADGSRNNYTLPLLGAANTPYARSVNPVTMTPAARPDPWLLFDSLMARQEFKENPNRVSSIFFNWASIVIHDLFQTDHEDPSISRTSSYLDLSVLYGDTQEDQDTMRTFKDGKIKPDCFAEQRLLAFPPTAGVMIILMNRWHNYVVENLAAINEDGRFTKPSDELSEDRKTAAWKKYDEDLFQTGRLVTCALYINITLYDYLRTIVNLNRVNSTWTLDPRMEKPKNFPEEGTPRGLGNQVSAEFALCYRWHSCIGELDDAWTTKVYTELFGKDPDDVDMKELMIGLAKYDHDLPEDPMERPFTDLQRGPDGKYNDEDLAAIMINGIEQVSGAFGARNTPKNMRAITVLGIMQARTWNLCTLNEFRAFFGLKRFETFEEINSDPYVAEQLKNLYEHPDYVELYPGIAIEEAKTPMVPGVGICPNHTLARAVLSDAVALVRGDRFYTLDHSPKNLTNWGFNESNYDLGINQGCVFYKLLINALPNHFKSDSIYAHYPMTVPDENAKIMKDLGRFHDYSWEKPTYTKPATRISTYPNVKRILEQPKDFAVTWAEGLGHAMGSGGERFCLAGDTVFHRKQRETMQSLIYRDEWDNQIKEFYHKVTLRLIAEKSVRIAAINQVDIVRDIGNLAHVHFASAVFGLPLKTAENVKGVFTEHELWMAMAVIYTSVFLNFEPTKSYPLRHVSRRLATMLGKLVELNIKSVTTSGFAARFFDQRREHQNVLTEYGNNMIRALSETGMSTYDMSFSQITPTAVSMVPKQSQAFAQIMDYYLGEGKVHWPAIQKLAQEDTTENDEKLMRYIQEAIRLRSTFITSRRAEVSHVFEENGKQISVEPGDKVLCNIAQAGLDESVFPNPTEVKLDRPLESYIHYGVGEHACLSQRASQIALTAMLRTVAKLPGVRRASGPQGQLKKVSRSGRYDVYMTEHQDRYFSFPTTMKIHFDGHIPSVPTGIADH